MRAESYKAMENVSIKFFIFAILVFSPLAVGTASASAVHDCFAETEVVEVLGADTRAGKFENEVKLKIKNNLAVSLCTSVTSSSERRGFRTISAEWDSSLPKEEVLKTFRTNLGPGSKVKLKIHSGSSMGANGAVPFEVFYLMDVKP